MAVVPSIAKMRGQQHGPEHVVMALEQLLGLSASGKSEHLSFLHQRMIELGVGVQSRMRPELPEPSRIEYETDEDTDVGSSLSLCEASS